MNYLNGELNWSFQPSQALCFYNDNSVVQNGNVSGDYNVRDYIRNFASQNNKGMPDMVYIPNPSTTSSMGYLFFNVKMDYIYFSVASYQIEFALYTFDNDILNDMSTQESVTYLRTSDENGQCSQNTFETMTYGRYKTWFGSQRSSVFDLSRMQYYFNDIPSDELENHVFNAYDSRPDNSLFYKYCLRVSGYNINTNTITIHHASDKMGSAIYNSWQTAMETGYTSGYGNGYADGYADGYNTNLDHETLNAFNYISQAFTAVSDVLAIQILPHVTLGLVFSIPMVFTLILLTFKLVKK